MKDYSKMSDFEINKAVAINRGGYQGHVEHMEHGVKESDRDSHGIFYFERDYCNNPSDAWPIIFSSRTMLNPYCADELWKAEVPCGFDGLFKEYATCYHRNPLRAAMIVFLMMQEKEAKTVFDMGGFSKAMIVPTPMGSGFHLHLVRFGKAGTEVVERQRGGWRVFSSIDAAANTAHGIGFRRIEIDLSSR